MRLLGQCWLAGRAPNQFMTAPFVPRRCGKKEGISDLAARAPTIHTSEKSRKKKWLDRERYWAGITPLPASQF
jgi:hypothetical protein